MPRGPYAKTTAQRQRILDVALEVFARSGDRGGSLREIADQVGMSQAGVLHHFGSKTALLQAVLKRREEEDRKPARVGLDEQIAYARGLLERGAEQPGVFQLHVTLSAEATDPRHPAHQFFAERYADVAEEFVTPLQAAVDAGRVDPEVDLEAVAHLVIAAMDGLQLQRQLNPDVDVVKSFDLLTTALLTTHATDRGEGSHVD